jgi:hypothetical protein
MRSAILLTASLVSLTATTLETSADGATTVLRYTRLE